MSTIASPRPSLTLSSRRTSTSTDTTTLSNPSLRPHQPTAAASAPGRRNRAALRDYYGLKTNIPSEDNQGSTQKTPLTVIEPESELDKADFDADTYVQTLLSTQSLEGVLRVEAELVSEIRTLDGEKKALVYDNYSKLIAATDTIRSMREKMDPVIPSTSSLGEDIGKVASTAADLAENLRRSSNGVVEDEGVKRKGEEQRTVRWALDTPRRLEELLDDDRRGEAERDWDEVSRLLDKWDGVQGVTELRAACLRVLHRTDGDEPL